MQPHDCVSVLCSWNSIALLESKIQSGPKSREHICAFILVNIRSEIPYVGHQPQGSSWRTTSHSDIRSLPTPPGMHRCVNRLYPPSIPRQELTFQHISNLSETMSLQDLSKPTCAWTMPQSVLKRHREKLRKSVPDAVAIVPSSTEHGHQYRHARIALPRISRLSYPNTPPPQCRPFSPVIEGGTSKLADVSAMVVRVQTSQTTNEHHLAVRSDVGFSCAHALFVHEIHSRCRMTCGRVEFQLTNPYWQVHTKQRRSSPGSVGPCGRKSISTVDASLTADANAMP